jgi:hypothetical protein
VHESARFGAAIRQPAEGAYAVAPVEPLYARIDVVGTAEGPAVIGLELIEPALYLDTDPGSAAVLADALLAATAQ